MIVPLDLESRPSPRYCNDCTNRLLEKSDSTVAPSTEWTSAISEITPPSFRNTPLSST